MSSRVSALFTAAARGNLTAVRLVLEHGDAGGAPAVDARTADARGDTALHVAAAHMKWPVVSWLAANGADPDARNVAGHTALDVIPTAEGEGRVRRHFGEGAVPAREPRREKDRGIPRALPRRRRERRARRQRPRARSHRETFRDGRAVHRGPHRGTNERT